MFVKNVQIDETVEQLSRNNRVSINCALHLGGNYQINVLREVLLVKDGVRFKAGRDYEYSYPVVRDLNDIQADEVTLPAELGGLTLTAAQVAAALELFTDKYAEEDDPRASSSSSSA